MRMGVRNIWIIIALLVGTLATGIFDSSAVGVSLGASVLVAAMIYGRVRGRPQYVSTCFASVALTGLLMSMTLAASLVVGGIAAIFAFFFDLRASHAGN